MVIKDPKVIRDQMGRKGSRVLKGQMDLLVFKERLVLGVPKVIREWKVPKVRLGIKECLETKVQQDHWEDKDPEERKVREVIKDRWVNKVYKDLKGLKV